MRHLYIETERTAFLEYSVILNLTLRNKFLYFQFNIMLICLFNFIVKLIYKYFNPVSKFKVGKKHPIYIQT